MGAKPQIVVLSSIDWSQTWQRHQIFASAWARAGHDVFFVENTGLRNPGPGDWRRAAGKLAAWVRRPKEAAAPDRVRVIKPRVLPPNGRLFRRINAQRLVPALIEAMAGQGLRPRPVVIAHFPGATSLEIIERLDPFLVVYDCASNFRAHPEAPGDLAELEERLLDRASLVVCDSDFLYRQKMEEHGRVLQIHQGADPSFLRLRPAAGFRRCLYHGTWSADLDPAYLESLAEAGFEVSVLGPSKPPAPPLSPRVRRLPAVPAAELPGRLESFDVLVWPYRLNPFLQAVVPAKLYEGLASGRPILATPLPAFQALSGLIHTSDSPAEWVRVVQGLPLSESAQTRARRMEAARGHTHETEFERLRRAVLEPWTKPA